MGFGIYTRVYGNSEYSLAYACSCGNKFNNSNENVRNVGTHILKESIMGEITVR